MKKVITLTLGLALAAGTCRYLETRISNSQVRRIVANPGDTVEIRGGAVFVNGAATH